MPLTGTVQMTPQDASSILLCHGIKGYKLILHVTGHAHRGLSQLQHNTKPSKQGSAVMRVCKAGDVRRTEQRCKWLYHVTHLD